MTFSLQDDKLGFKLGEVLVGLESGTTDNPESIWVTQHGMHMLPFLWNPDTLSYEVETVIRRVNVVDPVATENPSIDAKGVVVRPVPAWNLDYAGRAPFNTLFGDAVVGWHTDDISVQFQYNNATRDVTPSVSGSGATSNNGAAQAVISIGTTVGDARLTSVDPIRYRPGHEALAQYTSVYEGPQAGVKHYHGIMNTTDGAAFGYQNGVFGCWFIEGGVETFYPQSAWEADDKLDGAGGTGFNLNPAKKNVYMVQFGWLGSAPILFSVYTGLRYGWRLVHWVDRTNTETTPHLDNPSLPIAARVVRASGTGTAAAIKTSSWRGGVTTGEDEVNGSNRWNTNTLLDAAVAASTRNSIFSIINNSTFQSKTNHVVIELGVVTFVNDANKTVAFYGVKGPIGTVVTGGTGPVSVDSVNSVVTIRTGGTITGGTQGPATVVKNGQDRRTEVLGTGIIIYPGEEFAFECFGGAGLSGTVSLSARWVERF